MINTFDLRNVTGDPADFKAKRVKTEDDRYDARLLRRLMLENNFETANRLATDGSEITHLRDCRFLLFDRLEEARAFCEAQVLRYPFTCCEIFDADGKAKPPLLVIMHSARKNELSATWVRRRKVIAIAALVAVPALFIADWRSECEL